jgi:LPS sulfotransferase NodH
LAYSNVLEWRIIFRMGAPLEEYAEWVRHPRLPERPLPNPDADPVFDHEQIAALAREAVAHDAAWQRWFAANEIEPFTVRFEDLVTDTVGTTRSVLEFLGIRADGVVIAELTAKTNDSLSAEWLARYRACGHD